MFIRNSYIPKYCTYRSKYLGIVFSRGINKIWFLFLFIFKFTKPSKIEAVSNLRTTMEIPKMPDIIKFGKIGQGF